MSDRLIAALLVALLIVAVTVLTATGHGTTQLLTLLASPAVVAALSWLLLKRQGAQQVTLDKVARQTDGLLSASLAGIKATGDATGAQVRQLVDVAPDLPTTAPRDRPVAETP